MVGVFGLEAAKLSQGTVADGVTGSNAEGALVTVTGCVTAPPPKVAFRNTTLGLAEMVFCARNATAVLNSTAAIVSVRNKCVKGFNLILQQRL